MLKYDTELDFSIVTSLSLIAQRIRPNSRILEFGPATGYMTKYFKEKLNCQIVAVELDPDSARLTAPFCEKMIIGNIDTYPWAEELQNDRFDHIIFSDVLEHLYDPWTALKKASALLKDEGTMLTSIPNVAHSAIIMSLIQGNFDYSSIGLLDKTHIRFFTQKSILELLNQAQLKPLEWLHTQCTPEQSEFKVFYKSFPKEVENTLKNRQNAEVYQYVTVSKKSATTESLTLPKTDIALLGFDIPSTSAWFLDSFGKLLPNQIKLRLKGGNSWTNYSAPVEIPFDLSCFGLLLSDQTAVCSIKNVSFTLDDNSIFAVPLKTVQIEKGIFLKPTAPDELNVLSFGEAILQFSLVEKKSSRIKSFNFEVKINRDFNEVISKTNFALNIMGPSQNEVLENVSARLSQAQNHADTQSHEIKLLRERLNKYENNPLIKVLKKIRNQIKG